MLWVISIGIFVAEESKILSTPRKIWDEEDRWYNEIEQPVDYKELRKTNPHIWID